MEEFIGIPRVMTFNQIQLQGMKKCRIQYLIVLIAVSGPYTTTTLIGILKYYLGQTMTFVLLWVSRAVVPSTKYKYWFHLEICIISH